MRHRPTLAAAVVALGLAPAHAPAQPADDDPVQTIAARVTGAFTDGQRTLRIAAAPCGGHDLCLYVEMSARGGERRPMRQMVWTLDDATDAGADATVFLFPPRRLDTFVMSPADAAVGLWAAPLRFPTLDLDTLLPAGRARLDLTPEGWRLSAPDGLIVHRGAARSMSLSASEHAGTLAWSDRWLDRAGGAVDAAAATLQRTDEPAHVEITDEGLVIIDLRPGEGPALEPGDAAVVNFAVYLFTGQIVDSTWLESRKEHIIFSAPGEMFLGFQKGVLGMRGPITHGPEESRHLRRLVVPPALAFGVKGRDPIIDENAPLIVDIEMITIKKKQKTR
ncbi:MAG: hypothetical protein D6693_03615 [Planctomycetota bacterium]|nr:MAG: hypothetical protein D6693_03615 [Planctomycetota bacterium]